MQRPRSQRDSHTDWVAFSMTFYSSVKDAAHSGPKALCIEEDDDDDFKALTEAMVI